MSFENGFPFTIKPDGTQADVTPINNKDFKFTELHKLCECDMIQIVEVHPVHKKRGWIIVLDEEGKLKEEPQYNEVASQLFNQPYDLIVGTVLVCPSRYVK